MSKNIVLIGLSGTGKTTIGNILKTQLKDFNFVDTDEMIVKRENRSINEIFSKDGEERFRELETITLKEIFNIDNQIISTGGGIILREENLKMLKKNGVVFYLKTNPDVLIERLKGDNSRPLLETDDIKSKLHSLLETREKLYEKADFIIVTDDFTPTETADKIVRIYNERS